MTTHRDLCKNSLRKRLREWHQRNSFLGAQAVFAREHSRRVPAWFEQALVAQLCGEHAALWTCEGAGRVARSLPVHLDDEEAFAQRWCLRVVED